MPLANNFTVKDPEIKVTGILKRFAYIAGYRSQTLYQK
jgi:hypothetical protein